MNTAVPSLRLQGVSRSFGGVRVVADCTFAREQPGIVGIAGANGVGKTTLLRIIAQLLRATSGTVRICDVDIDDAPQAARALVGYAPHTPMAWRDMDVAWNLRQAARLAGCVDDMRAVAAALQTWQLEAVAATPFRELSRGWQQRYSLARADLTAPPVLLLDEPTAALDRTARSLLDVRLRRWAADRIVVVTSHEQEWLDGISSQRLELAA